MIRLQLKDWIFLNLGKGAARAAKHLAIKVALIVNRALELAADSSTADASGNPKATAATLSSFFKIYSPTQWTVLTKNIRQKQF